MYIIDEEKIPTQLAKLQATYSEVIIARLTLNPVFVCSTKKKKKFLLFTCFMLLPKCFSERLQAENSSLNNF